MLDIKFIRENIDVIKEGARKKHIDVDIDKLIVLDDKRKILLESIEKSRALQNAFSKKIVHIANIEEKNSLLEEMKRVKESLQKEEEEIKEVMKEWQMVMLKVPNVPDMAVPEGENETQNVEVRKWGEPKNFEFAPKDHIEILQGLDMADFERGAKIAGFRGYVLSGDLVKLNFALWQFALSHFTKKGFIPIMVPSLVNRELLFGTGYLPQGEEDLYKTQDGTYLSGTGEVGGMGIHMDEVLEKKDLPKKYLAFSDCFRREAGSHGKDVKGLFRVHEFFKFEQLILCEANHQTSVDFHEELTKNAEEFLQALGLPYRLVLNCGGDLGLGQVKKYDIEAWRPEKKNYGETHSSSYFHDFQTRRLNIRYRDDDGKLRFVHSLNNTAVASPRILIPLLENYQQADGTVAIPQVLEPYMGGQKVIGLRG